MEIGPGKSSRGDGQGDPVGILGEQLPRRRFGWVWHRWRAPSRSDGRPFRSGRFGLVWVALLGLLGIGAGCQRRAEVTVQPGGASSTPAASPGTLPAAQSTQNVSANSPSILPRAPVAIKEKHVVTVHGQELSDDYHWLQNKEDERVIHYLDAENRYADAVLQHTEVLQKKLFEEFKARTKENDQSVPQKWGDYFYYTKWQKDEQYNVHCRRRGKIDAPEQVILDENDLAKDKDFFALGAAELSHDQRWLVYGSDTSGSEEYTLRVKDLEKNELLSDTVPGAGGAVAWAGDNKTFFYTTRDGTYRPFRLYRHVVGTDQKQDVLVYEEKDPAFFLSVGSSRSQRFVVMELTSNSSSEVRILDASLPTGEFKIVEPRRPGIEYGIRHQGDTFWIITNYGAKNFRLMSAPVATPSREHWREVIPNRDDVKLDGAEVFANHLVLQERRGGLPTMRVRDVKTGEMHEIEFTEPGYSVSMEENPEFATQKIRFSYSSPVTPPSVYDYDMVTRERKLLKQDDVPDYDASQYQTERIEAAAADGTRVPITLVYKRGLKRDGKNPTLLAGYGAYGLCEDPAFDVARLSLLDRGFICATAHIRGGGEMGRAWYDDGKLKNKPKSFSDFIACAEHLFKEKYTSPQHLAITGASAGGMLVGAVVNQRPDICHVALADVPFVDVLNTMLDPKMPLTVTEYDEWGNPQQREAFDLIRSYSPYDNVRKQQYPHMLIRGSLNDSRVSFWEPAKWVAKLRATKTGDQLLLMKIDLEAGHNGTSGRYDYLDTQATEFAFLLDCLGESDK